ncbi:MAG: nitroreductase family protein [Caldilineaceae bacterium]|nr:nitroreductase family protein [Caldilineaceae bacterium]
MTPTITLDKSAVTEYPLHELIRNRWSPRAFSSRAVAAEKLGSLFEAARWAASSRNEQPWRFIVVTREDEEAFNRAFSCLMEGNQKWNHTVPVLLFGIAKRNWSHNSNPNAYAWYDLGQAVATLALQAVAEGLAVHQMGGFHKDRVRELFAIPEDYEPVVAVAVGYRGEVEDLPEDQRQREVAPRNRKPLSELVFEGDWGEPSSLASR